MPQLKKGALGRAKMRFNRCCLDPEITTGIRESICNYLFITISYISQSYLSICNLYINTDIPFRNMSVSILIGVQYHNHNILYIYKICNIWVFATVSMKLFVTENNWALYCSGTLRALALILKSRFRGTFHASDRFNSGAVMDIFSSLKTT